MVQLPHAAMGSRYEEVRNNVLCFRGVGGVECQGLSLILHRGLATWMGVGVDLNATRIAIPTPVVSAAADSTTDNQVTAQIVTIIATMALNK